MNWTKYLITWLSLLPVVYCCNSQCKCSSSVFKFTEGGTMDCLNHKGQLKLNHIPQNISTLKVNLAQLPKSFFKLNLTHIVSLVLKDGTLESSIFQNLTRLESLTLHNVSFGPKNDVFNGLFTLSRLDLLELDLSLFPAKSLENIKIDVLVVDKCYNVTVKFFEYLSGQKVELKYVTLPSTQLFTKPVETTALWLIDVQFKSVGPLRFSDLLYGLTKLQTLELSGVSNSFILDAELFIHTPSIERLVVEHSNLTEIAPRAFQHLKILKLLSLHMNNLQHYHAQSFLNLSTLLIQLKLDYLLLQCDCNMLQSMSQLKKGNVDLRIKGECVSRSDLKRKPLISIHDQDTCLNSTCMLNSTTDITCLNEYIPVPADTSQNITFGSTTTTSPTTTSPTTKVSIKNQTDVVTPVYSPSSSSSNDLVIGVAVSVCAVTLAMILLVVFICIIKKKRKKKDAKRSYKSKVVERDYGWKIGFTPARVRRAEISGEVNHYEDNKLRSNKIESEKINEITYENTEGRYFYIVANQDAIKSEKIDNGEFVTVQNENVMEIDPGEPEYDNIIDSAEVNEHVQRDNHVAIEINVDNASIHGNLSESSTLDSMSSSSEYINKLNGSEMNLYEQINHGYDASDEESACPDSTNSHQVPPLTKTGDADFGYCNVRCDV